MGIPRTPSQAVDLTFAAWDNKSTHPVTGVPVQVVNLPRGVIGLPKAGAVPLLKPGDDRPSGALINANTLPEGDVFSQSRVLGRTIDPEKVVPNHCHANQVRSLLKAVDNLAVSSSVGATPRPPKIVQFISPKAFNNPGNSKDSPMSGLLNELIGTNVAEFRIKQISKPSIGCRGDGCQSRSFIVKYSDSNSGAEKTFELVEMAPLFKNSLMSSETIKQLVESLEFSHQALSNACMLSYNGIGRTSIVHTVLEARQKIGDAKADGVAVSQEWIGKLVELIVSGIEKHRPPYLSLKGNSAQRRQIIDYLLDWEKKLEPPSRRPISHSRHALTRSASSDSIAYSEALESDKYCDELSDWSGDIPECNVAVGDSVSTDPNKHDGFVPVFKSNISPEPTLGESETNDVLLSSQDSIVSESRVNNELGETSLNKISTNARNLGLVGPLNSCYVHSFLKIIMLNVGDALIKQMDNAKKGKENENKIMKSCIDSFSLDQTSMGEASLPKESVEKIIDIAGLHSVLDNATTYRDLLKNKKDAMYEQLKDMLDIDVSTSSNLDELLNSKITPSKEDKDELYKTCMNIIQDWKKEETKLEGKPPQEFADRLCSAIGRGRFLPEFREKLGDFYRRIEEEKIRLHNSLINILTSEESVDDLDEEITKEIRSLDGEFTKKIQARITRNTELINSLETVKDFLDKIRQLGSTSKYRVCSVPQEVRNAVVDICGFETERKVLEGKNKQSKETGNTEYGKQQSALDVWMGFENHLGDDIFFKHAVPGHGVASGQGLRLMAGEKSGTFNQAVTESFQDFLSNWPNPHANYVEHWQKHGAYMPVIPCRDEDGKITKPFEEMNFYQSFDLNVNEKKVTFQANSIILHSGWTVERGHYVTLQREGDDWWLHDDSHQPRVVNIQDYKNQTPVMIRFEVLDTTQTTA